MSNPYTQGFVKRAQEYGLTANQAFELGKQAGLEQLLNKGKEHFGKGFESLKGMIAGIPASFPGDDQTEYANITRNLGLGEALGMGWDNLNPAAKGALVGGGLGLAGGALNSGEDEYGETHRLRNALLGGAGGAAVGAGGAHLYAHKGDLHQKYKDILSKLTSKPSKEVYGPVLDEAGQKDLLGDDYSENDQNPPMNFDHVNPFDWPYIG